MDQPPDARAALPDLDTPDAPIRPHCLVRTDDDGEPADTTPSYIRVGDRSPAWSDLYHVTLRLSWPRFLAAGFGLAVALNLVFALLYLAVGGLEGGTMGAFADAFYFSVQTMSTVGYGNLHPVTHPANLLASLEAMLGMTGFALAAAVSYARVSRPSARLLFSRVAVVARHEGRPALMFRCANRGYNHILEAKVAVTLVQTEATPEGERMRGFHELALKHPSTPVFALPWTIIHPIDADSPLHGRTQEQLAQAGAEIIVLLSGIDDAYGQAVHARHSYIATELRWDARFADVLTRARDGRTRIDLRRFHDVQPESGPPVQGA